MTQANPSIRGIVAAARHYEPGRVTLPSGGVTQWFVDLEGGLSRGAELASVVEAIGCNPLGGVDFDVIGGLSPGADALVHALAVFREKRWFTMGEHDIIRGFTPEPEQRVVLLGDVVVTGGSLRRACAVVERLDAQVVKAVAVLNRDRDVTSRLFEDGWCVPFQALLDFEDIGIPAVSEETGAVEGGEGPGGGGDPRGAGGDRGGLGRRHRVPVVGFATPKAGSGGSTSERHHRGSAEEALSNAVAGLEYRMDLVETGLEECRALLDDVLSWFASLSEIAAHPGPQRGPVSFAGFAQAPRGEAQFPIYTLRRQEGIDQTPAENRLHGNKDLTD